MRTYLTVALIAALHVGAVLSVVFVQGCRSPGARYAAEETRPAPVTTAPMPPTDAALASTVSPAFKPTYIPPAPAHKPAAAATTVAAGDAYIVQKGDTLSQIAKRHSLTMAELAQANNINDPNRLRAGQKLIIPAASGTYVASPAAPAVEPTKVSDGSAYVVQSGDTLSHIAKRYGVTVAALRETNHLAGDKLLVGQKLVIPSGTYVQPTSMPTPQPTTEHVSFAVESQDVAASEAASYSVPPEPPAVQAETFATQQDFEQSPPSVSAHVIEHVVRDGDTLASIAKLYMTKADDLARYNGLPSEHTPLSPGQRLRIP